MKKLPRVLTEWMRALSVGAVVASIFVFDARPALGADSAQAIYTRALSRERLIRNAANNATLTQMRGAIRTYETVVRRFPRSGYCDNALWQAANVALLAFERFGEASDKRTAKRLFTHLRQQYPASALAGRADEMLRRLDSIVPERVEAAPLPAVAVTPATPALAPALERKEAPAPSTDAPDARPASGTVTIKDIKRTALPDGIRVSIEMDGESLYRSERLDNPRRVFFDLKSTRATLSLQDATIRFGDDIVREIRLGRHPNNTTRIVMDLEAVESYSVFTLYNPFRLVVDFRRSASAARPATPSAAPAHTLPGPRAFAADARLASAEAKAVPAAKDPLPLIPLPAQPELITPTVPAANANGQFSIARQLGLGISRIVLDPGHGGHDPGARANGLNEAELVLDVTLRLRELLEKQPGIEVTLTRDSNQFIPLEERTAIANRAGADLFLSIHANASRNTRARGVETYFLNFASNPEAEALAARENVGSGKSMHSLPEIVRAIALNNKIDESRDFAEMVQRAMVRRLTPRNNQVKDLGVKQAPFVVLIGATMPSVLAEISFVTNKQESALLKTGAYRQQIAESLFDAIVRYQGSLRGARAVASRE
jgi:N-acetylmuramoyl-L-alanine amidase